MRHYEKELLKILMGISMGLCLMVAVCMTGNAAEEANADDTVTPLSIEASKTVSLSITSGTATSTCRVSGTSGGVTKISITMNLQKKSSDGTYSNIATWSGSKESYYYNISKTKNVAKGTYRVKAKITCYKGSTSETTTKYSSAKTY